MGFKISLVLFSFILHISVGQQILPWTFGRCLNPSTVQSFNAAEFFTGRWYQQMSYGNQLFEWPGICPTLVSRLTDNGNILIKTYNYNTALNRYISLDGTGSLNELSTGQNFFTITFLGLGFLPVRVPFYILGTDYTDWAVLYSCRQNWLTKSEMAFVLTRDRGIIGNVSEVSRTILSAWLDFNKFVPSINTGCGPNEPTV